MKPQLPEISVSILDYVRYHHNSSSADPPSSLLSVCPIHLAKKPQCLLSSTLCLPHVHTHRVVEAGERPSHLADWTRFKFMTICASRWPLVLVGSDSTFLSTLLACSPRFFCTFFSFWDLSLAPPPFASFSAAFNFTEHRSNQKELSSSFTITSTSSQASVPTYSFFLLSLWKDYPCSWLRLSWPMCTQFHAFSNILGHLFSSYPHPSVSSNLSSDWPCLPLLLHFFLPCYSKTPWHSCLPADDITFLPLSLGPNSHQAFPSAIPSKSQPHFVVARKQKKEIKTNQKITFGVRLGSSFSFTLSVSNLCKSCWL